VGNLIGVVAKNGVLTIKPTRPEWVPKNKIKISKAFGAWDVKGYGG
jgi:hypothetical protein